jgi:hypothetical protein
MLAEFWQLLLVDSLFLCLAAGLGLWLRGLVRGQRLELDGRLDRLDAHLQQLQQLQTRQEQTCRRLEGLAGLSQQDEPGAPGPPGATQKRPTPSRGYPRREDAVDKYEQAWALLSAGTATGDVARQLGLGVAEVELMGRIQRHRQKP